MQSKIKTAVFPVAGLGSRFFPATKSTPKEMLPIVDKPLIQYAVEEAYQAGMTHMVFITSNKKRTIEDHFDKDDELEARLTEKKQFELLSKIESISPNEVKFTYIRQSKALGLGHAIACAEHIVQKEAFAVLLADDLLYHPSHSFLSSMIKCFHQHHAPVLAVQEVPKQDTEKFGIVKTGSFRDNNAFIESIIEKPTPEEAPSTLGVIGRYILSPDIFAYLNKTPQDKRGEIQLTDAFSLMLKEQKLCAYHFQGKRYDCGSKSGFLEATVDYGLRHPETKRALKKMISRLQTETESCI